MRFRSFATLVFAAVVPCALRAQDEPDGIMAGNYLRIAAGPMSPVNPSGSLKNWKRGAGFSLGWESWQSMGTGAPRAGFGIVADYSLLPLNEQHFISNFQTDQGAHPTSASANKAAVFTIATSLRVRIPAPLVVPSVEFGFGLIDYKPSKVDYVAQGTPGSAPQQSRTGAEVSIGGGLDRQLAGRVAVYAEALYRYGFTSIGQGVAAPGSACIENGCDALKNTSFGTIRGGLRVRVGR